MKSTRIQAAVCGAALLASSTGHCAVRLDHLAKTSPWEPVIGSCTPSAMGQQWCDCSLYSNDQGSTVKGTIQCSRLYCYHMEDFEKDDHCLYPPKGATCEISNQAIADLSCAQHVTIDGVVHPTSTAACDQVVSCLNDPTCTTAYCGGTPVRGAWQLNGIKADPKPHARKRKG